MKTKHLLIWIICVIWLWFIIINIFGWINNNNHLYNIYNDVYYWTVENIWEKTMVSWKIFDNKIDAKIGEKLFIYPNQNHITNVGRLNCNDVEIEFSDDFKNRDIEYAYRFMSLSIVWNEKLCKNWWKHVN